MDLHDDHRRDGEAPAGALTPERRALFGDALTAAEESAAAAAAAGGAPLLCAQCVGVLGHPVYGIRVSDASVLPPGDTAWRLRKALALVDAGHVLTDQQFGILGMYAVTVIRGTAVCAHHCYVVANESGRGFPFYV